MATKSDHALCVKIALTCAAVTGLATGVARCFAMDLFQMWPKESLLGKVVHGLLL